MDIRLCVHETCCHCRPRASARVSAYIDSLSSAGWHVDMCRVGKANTLMQCQSINNETVCCLLAAPAGSYTFTFANIVLSSKAL